VRVAREVALVRARRQTVQTRLWFALSMAALALVGVAVGPRLVRPRHPRLQAATTPAQPPATSPAAAAAAAIPVPPAGPPSAPAMAPAPIAAPAPEPATAPANEGTAAAAQGCDTALVRTAPWRLSPDACAVAFEADPTNARLALAIAHAEHVRGHSAEASQWATRALGLDPKTAEAYVLIARADMKGGRGEYAREAYRRYLELAPRGWHQAEARKALAATAK
jgi:tetratricopeptide (TPR) repeat protein